MSDNWMTLAKQFSENGFAAYTVDQRNHGRSEHSDEFNYHLMADDLYALMEDLQLSSADIIGHSMGGKTAMFFATMYPEKTDKLVIVDIAPRYYSFQNDTVLNALRPINLSVIHSRKEVEEQLRVSLKDEATIQFLLKNLYWEEAGQGTRDEGQEARDEGQETGDKGRGTILGVPEKKLAWRFNIDSIEKNREAIGEALPDDARFEKPVLFIRGEKSNYITSEDEPLIKKHFPQSEITTIPNAGHWVHAENPNGFMEVVLGFLNI